MKDEHGKERKRENLCKKVPGFMKKGSSVIARIKLTKPLQ